MCSIKKRVLLVGDTCCGKSALAFKLTQNLFLDLYQPTGFDDFQTELWTPLGLCDLTILDISGDHRDKDIRARMYNSCDAVVICFDLCKQATLASVEEFWLPEVKQYCANIPIYIAGCKKDAACKAICNCNSRDCCVQTDGELLKFMDKTGAVAYTECSARATDSGVEDWFSAVVESSHQKKTNNAKRMLSILRKRSKSVRRRFS